MGQTILQIVPYSELVDVVAGAAARGEVLRVAVW